MPKFRLPKRTAIVKFTEGDFVGAEVTCSLDVPMRTILSFRRMTTGDPDEVEGGFKMFADQVLIGWNLEDDNGAEIPCNAGTFLDMPLAFLNAVTGGWIEATTGVPKDSSDESRNGSTSEEESTPTETS